MRIDAFHLPALPDIPTRSVRYDGRSGPVEVRYPVLDPARLQRQLDALGRARRIHLEGRPADEIAALIGRVADRFLDPSDELRARALAGIGTITGLSPEMAEHTLDGMAADWREPALLKLLDAEFADRRVLDGFVQGVDDGTRRMAVGPGLTFHVFSGNVPGVAVTSLVRALLVKSASLAKAASGEPLLAALFAAALAREDAGLGDCVAVAHWTGGDRALEEGALAAADAVIAYGGSRAIDSLRERAPDGLPFLAYGHRVSFGILAREALEGGGGELHAESAALAVATFDQQGCVSPHLFYVEEGGAISAREWAVRLASALERLAGKLPRGAISSSEASEIQQLRGEAQFAQLAGSGVELHQSVGGTDWSVIYDPDRDFAPSCLNRVVRVKPLADLEQVIEPVRGIASVLQTVALVGPERRTGSLATTLAKLGASRITSLDRMPWPPPSWHHDGRPALLDLVRWCDWE